MTDGAPVAEASGYGALTEAAIAIEAHDAGGLARALESTTHESLLQAAARHRCLGYLRAGILTLQVRDARARALTRALREYAGKAAVQAYGLATQVEELVATLDAAGVRFVLLKGAARLFRRDKEAESDTMFDLDILVPRSELAAARAALCSAGYRQVISNHLASFWERHHHAAPLRPPGVGVPVELHVQLAPAASLSIATGWESCERYFERVAGARSTATCFDPLGTAVHLLVHGLGMRRLHDVIMLARALRGRAALLDHLRAVSQTERRQPIALRAVIAAASRIAGIAAPSDAPVERYLEWIARREALAPHVRDRTQFVEAWYANGGSLLGPATRLALPTRDLEQGTMAFGATFVYRLLGRIGMSAYVAATHQTPATR